MKKQSDYIEEAHLIRKKAEKLLKIRQNKSSEHCSEADTLKLIHELQVHQIELELINDELLLANKKIAELANEKYKELYDFAPSGYLTLSKERKILELNFVAAEFLGRERSLLINKRFDFFISEDTLETFNCFLNDISSHSEKKSCELVLSTNGKQPKHVSIAGVEDKNNECCLITLIDISKIKQAETDVIAAKEKAEESDRLKSAFLANMSHEIRTPMNGILGFADLLKKPDLENEKQQKYIQIIEKSGARMLNIINEIIDISKIESGQMGMSITNVDINKCLDDCYDFFKSETEKRNLELKLTKGLPNIEAVIKTDQVKLDGTLNNLVKNAIKYTKQGSIEFGYYLNESGTELHFFVKDTGKGISKDRQAAIFERFIQADIEDKMAQQGAGLGLTISRAYVEMLDGKIWMESEVNVGSTFYFTLPYKNTNTSENDNYQPIIEKQKQTEGLKILIVEDDMASSQLLEIIVNEHSKEIFTAKKGKDAIEVCKNNQDIDLVLMDIQMPGGMNGYEATKQIRKFNKGVIVIAQTAFALTGDREKAIKVGCNDYISKPIKKDKFEHIIQQYFKK